MIELYKIAWDAAKLGDSVTADAARSAARTPGIAYSTTLDMHCKLAEVLAYSGDPDVVRRRQRLLLGIDGHKLALSRVIIPGHESFYPGFTTEKDQYQLSTSGGGSLSVCYETDPFTINPIHSPQDGYRPVRLNIVIQSVGRSDEELLDAMNTVSTARFSYANAQGVRVDIDPLSPHFGQATEPLIRKTSGSGPVRYRMERTHSGEEEDGMPIPYEDEPRHEGTPRLARVLLDAIRQSPAFQAAQPAAATA